MKWHKGKDLTYGIQILNPGNTNQQTMKLQWRRHNRQCSSANATKHQKTTENLSIHTLISFWYYFKLIIYITHTSNKENQDLFYSNQHTSETKRPFCWYYTFTEDGIWKELTELYIVDFSKSRCWNWKDLIWETEADKLTDWQMPDIFY